MNTTTYNFTQGLAEVSIKNPFDAAQGRPNFRPQQQGDLYNEWSGILIRRKNY